MKEPRSTRSFVIRHRRRVLVTSSLVSPVVLSVAFIPFRTSFTNVAAALCMVALIEALAVMGDRVSGVLATLSAAVSFDFFLTAPYERITITRLPDLQTTISILLIGVIVTEVAARSHRHRRAASEDAHFIAMLGDVVAMSSRNEKGSQILDCATSSLMTLLTLRACRFDPAIPDPPLARIQPSGEVVHVGLRWPVAEIGLPGPECEILCAHRGTRVGRFVLTPTPGFALTRERLTMAVVLASLAAISAREAGSSREYA